MYIKISHSISIPIIRTKLLKQALIRNTIKFDKFTEFKFDKNNHYTELYNTKRVMHKHSLDDISHLPYIAVYRKKQLGTINLNLTETGIFSLCNSYVLHNERDVKQTIKILKGEIINLNLGKICKEIFTNLVSISKEYNILNTVKIKFNPSVTTIYSFHDIDKLDSKDDIIDYYTDLGKFYGNSHMILKNHLTTYRLLSKSFNVLITFDPPTNSKGRRLLREGVFHAIHLAHGLSNMYKLYLSLFPIDINYYNWKIFLFFNNPKTILGRLYDDPLLGSSLERVWFGDLNKLLDLTNHLKNMLMRAIQESTLKTQDLIYLSYILRSIPSKKINPIILPTMQFLGYDLDENEIKILNILYDKHRKELEESSVSDLKYGPGLTVNGILKKIDKSPNGKKIANLKNILVKMVDRRLIDFIPYKGKGNRGKSNIYSVNYLMIDFRNDLLRYIDDIL